MHTDEGDVTMRAITGKYKGRHFDVPSSFNARPTTDFAKENLFNVLRSYVDFEGLHVLDLFAGTGSISLEFLSRGAERVVSVERDFKHYGFIRKVQDLLGNASWRPLHLDALRYIEKSEEPFSVVFADPPYALRELGSLPERVLGSKLLSDDGLFVLEHGREYDFSDHLNYVEHRVYGSVNFTFFRKGKTS